MNLMLAAATNSVPASQPNPGFFNGPFDPSSFVWAVFFTLAWDVIDLWLRYRRFNFVTTAAFILYVVFHIGLSAVATIVLAKSVETHWLVGLLAATANEMVLSNANVTFGKASLLPVLEKFRELRAAMQQEIDAIKKAQDSEFLEQLARLPLDTLVQKVTTLLVQVGQQPQEIQAQIDKLKTDCGNNHQLLATKLANDFIQLDRLYAQNALDEAKVKAQENR